MKTVGDDKTSTLSGNGTTVDVSNVNSFFLGVLFVTLNYVHCSFDDVD